MHLSYRGNCVPTSVVAWTLGGQPVSWTTGASSFGPMFNSRGTIPFGRYHGAVRLVSRSDDGLWPSERYENLIMRKLHAYPAAQVHFSYPNAGHADLDPSYTPVQLSNNDHGVHLNLGGTIAGNENAREHDWPTMLRFITSHYLRAAPREGLVPSDSAASSPT